MEVLEKTLEIMKDHVTDDTTDCVILVLTTFKWKQAFVFNFKSRNSTISANNTGFEK